MFECNGPGRKDDINCLLCRVTLVPLNIRLDSVSLARKHAKCRSWRMRGRPSAQHLKYDCGVDIKQRVWLYNVIKQQDWRRRINARDSLRNSPIEQAHFSFFLYFFLPNNHLLFFWNRIYRKCAFCCHNKE